jgi:CRISPR/Cas system CSM-associated protein Csm3 (group 7 of RAMP superfamily)
MKANRLVIAAAQMKFRAALTLRANKTFRPPQANQLLATLLLRCEPLLESGRVGGSKTEKVDKLRFDPSKVVSHREEEVVNAELAVP